MVHENVSTTKKKIINHQFYQLGPIQNCDDVFELGICLSIFRFSDFGILYLYFVYIISLSIYVPLDNKTQTSGIGTDINNVFTPAKVQYDAFCVFFIVNFASTNPTPTRNVAVGNIAMEMRAILPVPQVVSKGDSKMDD